MGFLLVEVTELVPKRSAGGASKASDTLFQTVQSRKEKVATKLGAIRKGCALRIPFLVATPPGATDMVEVTGLEPMASWSRTKRATNCATPRCYRYLIVFSGNNFCHLFWQLVAPKALPHCEHSSCGHATHSTPCCSFYALSQLRYTSYLLILSKR